MNEGVNTARTSLSGFRTWMLVLYNLMLATFLSWRLIIMVAGAPEGPKVLSVNPTSPTASTPSGTNTAGPASNRTEGPTPRQDDPLGPALISTLLTMAVAGAAGGTLCNLRGLFRWISVQGDFPRRFEAPFYVRPFTGAMTGLFVFFVGHLLVTSLSQQSTVHWRYLEGRLPYVGLAIIAGFAAQEFMQRLKEVAKTLFSESRPNDQSNPKAPSAET